MFCCSALSHYQTTLSLCPLCEEAFQSPRTFRVTTVRTFGVDYSKSNAINIQHTHIHTHPQLRLQVYRCVRAWVCVSCAVLCVQCLFRFFTCCSDFWWFCFAFCLFRVFLFVEQGQLLETHTDTCLPLRHLCMYVCFVDSSFVASFNRSLAADLA